MFEPLKYAVGDAVRVRRDLTLFDQFRPPPGHSNIRVPWTPTKEAKARECDYVFHISHVTLSGFYKCLEFGMHDKFFVDDMFEGLADESQTFDIDESALNEILLL